MNQIRIGLAAALLLGVSGLTFGQEGPDPKPPAQQEPRQEQMPPQQQEEARPKPEKPGKEEKEKPPKESKSEKESNKTQQATPEKGQPAAARQGNQEQGNREQGNQGHGRPAGKSGHIPDQKFKASFGHQHRFAARQVIQTTTVVAGQTQFVYSGFTFIILDPWPSDWLYTDDCYIDYEDDDYFLVDLLHPGIRIALFVQM